MCVCMCGTLCRDVSVCFNGHCAVVCLDLRCLWIHLLFLFASLQGNLVFISNLNVLLLSPTLNLIIIEQAHQRARGAVEDCRRLGQQTGVSTNRCEPGTDWCAEKLSIWKSGKPTSTSARGFP